MDLIHKGEGKVIRISFITFATSNFRTGKKSSWDETHEITWDRRLLQSGKSWELLLWNKVGKMMFHFLNFPAFIWVMIAIPFLKYCCLFFGEVLSSFFGSLLVLTIFSISTGANNIEKRSRSRQTTFSCTDKFLKISLTISLFLGLRNKAQNKTNWIIKTRSMKQQKMCQWILDSLLIKIMSLVR